MISNTRADGPKNDGSRMEYYNSCPECENMIVYQEGCILCPSCGYSHC